MTAWRNGLAELTIAAPFLRARAARLAFRNMAVILFGFNLSRAAGQGS